MSDQRPSKRRTELQPDEQVVQDVIDGDRQAYRLLVERYQRAVFAVAMRVLDDPHAANDAAQNAFVGAFEKLHSLRRRGAFGAWLLTIARREAVTIARANRKLQPLRCAEEPASEAEYESRIDQTQKDLLLALDRLPVHEQRPVMLRYFDGRTVAEVAEMTGYSVGTVTKQISRALKRLRKYLKDES